MEKWVRGTVVANRRWNDQLHSLRFDAPMTSFKAGQFTKIALDLHGERVSRPYSLVNQPDERPLEIYFNRVPDGPLSPALATLGEGDTLWVSREPKGAFTVDSLPDSRDLWLLATGTALGVYLSILRAGEVWDRFHNIVLVHGVRFSDELTYGSELEHLLEVHGDRFRPITLTSGERSSGGLSGRIPKALAEGLLEASAGLTLSPDLSHAMLCGNMGMIKATAAMLEERGLRRHRRSNPGQYTLEKYH